MLTHFTIAFGERFIYRLLEPPDLYLCIGPECAFSAALFSTLIVLPFRPLIFTHSMLPVLPIINPHCII